MAGVMYLGNQMVTPVIVQGEENNLLTNYEIDDGVIKQTTHELTGNEFNGVTKIGYRGFYYGFYHKSGITGRLDLSSITTIEDEGCWSGFYYCSGITSVDLSSLTTVGVDGLDSGFHYCSDIQTVDLSSLTTVGEYGMYSCFAYCVNIETLNLSSLTQVGSNGLAYLCRSCEKIKDVYFNSLTTSSFARSNALSGILSATGTGVVHTLHFPSNLQSTIQGLIGYPTFGGSSGYVVCAFDLPATS